MTWTDIAWRCLYALLIVGAGTVLGGVLRDATALALERTRLDLLVRRMLVSLVRPVVVALAAFAALAQLGIPMSTFAAMAGAATLAIGLALRNSLSNVASGAMLLSLRPFEVGDRVQAAGLEGIVARVGLFHTTLHDVEGDTLTLPNDAVWSSAITNFVDRPTRRILLRWPLPVDADVQRAAEALREVLEDPRFERTLILHDIDAGGPVIETVVHVPNELRVQARSDLSRDGLRALRAANLSLRTLPPR